MQVRKKEFFAKGKRGFIYTAKLGNKKIAIKEKNPESKAQSRIEFEAYWLKKLNKHKIGPKFIFFKDDSLAYEFVEGIFIEEFMENSTKEEINKVFIDLFNQMFLLDGLGVNKEEMHHPYKHIIITKKTKPVLLDFERANNTEKPSNVTQFCQFITSTNLHSLLNKKGFKINIRKVRAAAKKYKHNINKKNFEEIIKIISNPFLDFLNIFFKI
jgi:putative serine/threonine protein kinase